LVTRKTEQTQMALGMRTCSRHDPRRFAVRLLNTILGENMSSRLFQAVREDRGLAYSIYSTPSFFEDTGDIVISAGLETEKLPRALRLILAELRQLAAKPPAKTELRRAQDYVLGQISLSLESTESQMNWLGEQLLGYGRTFPPRLVKRRLLAVTPLEVQAAAQAFFLPENLNLALVSPLKEGASLQRLLNSACGQ
jgi:predicted Zn-dependent peptidase